LERFAKPLTETPSWRPARKRDLHPRVGGAPAGGVVTRTRALGSSDLVRDRPARVKRWGTSEGQVPSAGPCGPWVRNRARCSLRLWGAARSGSGRGRGKRVRGGAGKPGPRQRERRPQRGERQEGTARTSLAALEPAVRRGEAFEAEVCVRVRRATAWEDRAWERVRISGRIKALKAKAQERCRGETDPDGSEGCRDRTCDRPRVERASWFQKGSSVRSASCREGVSVPDHGGSLEA
jgi:hypothetical protein